MKRYLLISFLASFLLLPTLHAQENAAIIGYISDATSGETLIAANVYTLETQEGATTNTSGYYTVPDLKPGTYTIVASYIGYSDFSKKITLSPGERLRLDIEMQPSYIEGEAVVVEEELTIDEEKPVGLVTVPKALIKELPKVLEADLFRSIQLLPGIKAASDFSSGLYVRGGSPDQTLILLDRTTVYNPSHFFGFFSTFNPDAIKDVQIFKGGYPAEYGGRLGAVVDIYNRAGNRKEFQGRASIGLLASRLNLEGPLPKGSWMVAGRRSTLEPVLAVVRNNVDNVPDQFYFYDFNGKLNFDPTSNDRLNLAFYTGRDLVAFPITDNSEINLDYGNATVSGTWTHVFSKKVFSNFTGTYSRYFSTPDISIENTTFERENIVEDLSLKGDLEYVVSKKHSLKAGFWAGNLDYEIEERFDGMDTFQEFNTGNYGSVYLQEVWRPTSLWKFTGGIRANYFSAGDYMRYEPRAAIEYIYSRDMLFQLAYGRYYQFLTLVSNEAFTAFDTWLTVDEGVPPSYGDQFVFGFKNRLNESYNLDVEVYYRTMRDLFRIDPFLNDLAGLDYQDWFIFGDGYATGVEFFLQKSKGRLNGFVGYTLGLSRLKYDELNGGDYFSPKYDRTHDLNIVANYDLTRQWKITGVFSYATGQAYTQALGNYEVGLPTASESRFPLIVDNFNGARLPAYNRLDIGFTRTGKLWGQNYELQLQAINVYSRRNVWFYQYDFDDNPVTREDVVMLPIIPSISFTLDF